MTAVRLPESHGLPVWHAREGNGLWNPEKGALAIPEGWIFVPAGDAFVTREVKKGPHWILLKRRSKYTATLGVFCPEPSLTGAEDLREKTADARARQRRLARASRERLEQSHRSELESAILAYLGFAPENESLASEIARGTVTQTTPVGSGRVGRTRRISLGRRAELAARAYIRHRYTNYEAHLWGLSGENPTALEPDPHDPVYRSIKADANREVDAFLERHRTEFTQPVRLRKKR